MGRMLALTPVSNNCRRIVAFFGAGTLTNVTDIASPLLGILDAITVVGHLLRAGNCCHLRMGDRVQGPG